jgi:hypothetical protein
MQKHGMILLGFAAMLMLMTALPAQAAMDVQEGQWEITLTMKAGGVDQAFGPYSRNQCFTKADAQNPAKLFADTGGTSCEYSNQRYSANRFSFDVRCGGAIPLSGSGEVGFSADRFAGSMNLQAQLGDGQAVETHSEISGRRLGPCQR